MNIETQFAVLNMLTAGLIPAGLGGWWVAYQLLKRKEWGNV